MIAVETLLRLSFLRGGTDFDNFFLNRGGAVLIATVNKYVYVTVKEQLDDMICVDYSQRNGRQH